VASAVLVAVAGASAAGTDGPLRVPPDAPPAALASLTALDPLDSALAVALSGDGALAAAALPHPQKMKASLVRTTFDTVVRELEVRGSVRAMRFDSTGSTLFVVAHRDGKEGPVEAWLASVDLQSGKTLRTVTLPTSARGLAGWVGGGALLVACRDEVRTILLPEIRTGPLFWIAGDNLAVASLPGGDFALVGQEREILLVNLSDPQGRGQLPVRERVATSASVAQLAAAPDGSAALARLADGTTHRVSLEPLRLEPLAGASSFVAWLGPRPPAPLQPPAPAGALPEASEPPAAIARPESASAAPAPAPEPVVPAPVIPVPETTPERPATAATPSETESRPEPGASGPEREASAPPAPSEPEASASRPEAIPDRGSLEGRITGPAARAVVGVVLLGPDNILREARRVPLDSAGNWEATGLVPGSYRVILDGGGSVVVVSTPSFRQASVEEGVRLQVEPIEAVRTVAE